MVGVSTRTGHPHRPHPPSLGCQPKPNEAVPKSRNWHRRHRSAAAVWVVVIAPPKYHIRSPIHKIHMDTFDSWHPNLIAVLGPGSDPCKRGLVYFDDFCPWKHVIFHSKLVPSGHQTWQWKIGYFVRWSVHLQTSVCTGINIDFPLEPSWTFIYKAWSWMFIDFPCMVIYFP